MSRGILTGAEVLVFEKAAKIGGTTAWSGGMVWIPNNHLMAQNGVPDSSEEEQERISPEDYVGIIQGGWTGH